jgi:catechol 2,3-dioxygenase-like lactoylglutathione lyase family enzyme
MPRNHEARSTRAGRKSGARTSANRKTTAAERTSRRAARPKRATASSPPAARSERSAPATPRAASSKRSSAATSAQAPRLYRVILEVSDLARAERFYSALLASEGRRIHGSRLYFDCGPVILALLDPTAGGIAPKPSPGCLYFAVDDLEAVHTRAKRLRCLSTEDVHGASGGQIGVRPWGERSFYARDPFENELCFVDRSTLFTGR